jgi:hypothetical protein
VELRLPLSHRALLALGLVVGVVAVAMVWGDVVKKIRDVHPVAPHARPTAIVWADQVFTSRRALERWLRSHGSSYAAWVKQHPASAAVIDPRVRAKQVAVRHKRAVARRTHPVAAPRVRAAASGGGHLLRWLLVLGSFLVGLVCLLAAAAPRFELGRIAWPAAVRLERYGSFFVATGSAILVGLLIALTQG